MLIIHSDDDESVPVRQAHDMVAELEEAGVKHKFVHYKDRGHMRLTDEVVKEILEAAPDGSQFVPVLQQVRREGMTQRVAGDARRKPG